MYRRPKFLEVLLDIRQEMAREADYDVDLFAEMVRSGNGHNAPNLHRINETDDGSADEQQGKTARGKRRRVSAK
jgi:hypothetical protein